jgi:OOP family OmpA-OmpF porin
MASSPPTRPATGFTVADHAILFGLRDSFGAPPPPPAPTADAKVSAPAPAPARSYLVFFDWDKVTLTDRAADRG